MTAPDKAEEGPSADETSAARQAGQRTCAFGP